MQVKDHSPLIIAIIAAALIAGAFIASVLVKEEEEEEVLLHHRMTCVMELQPIADTSRALITGYNYLLLERYAADRGQETDISLSDRNVTLIDSLRSGAIDILVVPFTDSTALSDVLYSIPVDSMSYWLLNKDEHARMKDINRWLDKWHNSEEFDEVRAKFFKRFNAFRSHKRESISPYDEIIKKHADSLGWDWRLLAAVIYQESRFHIEAQSKSGAAGLMQMMPGTASRMGVDDPLDPETNISAGAQLLGRLINRYYKVGANTTERYKYALAAYNAGEGRIDDCLNLARARGVDTGYWINVVHNVIPLMGDENITDGGIVKVGPFKGVETVKYVDNVIAIYKRFCTICPDP